MDKSINGSIIFTMRQIPLTLSWDFNIHKYQGKELDKVLIDLGNSDNYCGMTLVALSRVWILR